MRTYLPRPRTIALAFAIAAIVVLVGAITHTYNIVAAGMVTVAVVLLITASIEGARHYWLTHGAGIAVEVRRANGERELVTLDPHDEESLARFSRAVEEDFARQAPTDAAPPVEGHIREKGSRSTGAC